jgi:lipid A 4'-phosphatase
MRWPTISRELLNYVLWAVSLLLVFLLLLRLLHPSLQKIKLKGVIYFLCVLIIVPVLIINVVFKDHFGRPRPRDVQQFGGSHVFQPAWSISRECDTNCSFVCGDCSAVFVFWALLPFFKTRRGKLIGGSVIFLLGCYYGLIRIGQGGHFLSDVVFSALLTYLGVWLVYAYFYLYAPKWTSDAALNKAFLRAHQTLLAK